MNRIEGLLETFPCDLCGGRGFDPRAYQRDRLFRLLAGLGLVDEGEAPATLTGKLSYYGARSLARNFVLRKRPLPLAKK